MNFEKLKKIIEKVISDINKDNEKFYLEATLQFEILKHLWSDEKLKNKYQIYPEVNIKGFNIKNTIKKEIDIALLDKKGGNVVIELKMPLNGQVPEQMFKFCEDIKFLEELKENNFSKCFAVLVTDNHLFKKGRKIDGIYKYFRNNEPLHGKIRKPTGEKDKIINLKNTYQIKWNKQGKWIYTILEI